MLAGRRLSRFKRVGWFSRQIRIFKEQNFAVNLCRYTLKYFLFNHYRDGGAMRDRTADLLRAKQALSQLSYSPITCS